MLSKRLQTIAAQIQKGQTMADIGTDHGFLPLFLWKTDICPKVIMTDVSEPSLNKAEEAFRAYLHMSCINDEIFDNDNKDVHFRLGNGLEVLAKNEVDVVVIAGMGGVLMTQILGADVTKTQSFDKYILQPRNGSGKLRFWLDKMDFEIESESLAEEGKFICEILIVRPPIKLKINNDGSTLDINVKVDKLNTQIQQSLLADYPDDIKYEIPRNLQNGCENIFNLFINNKLNIEKNILTAMVRGKITDKEKISRTKERIVFLEKTLRL